MHVVSATPKTMVLAQARRSGFPVRTTMGDHPILKDIDLSAFPPLLEFNQTMSCSDCESIMEIRYRDLWFPLLARRSLDRGRVSAWATGCQSPLGDQYGQLGPIQTVLAATFQPSRRLIPVFWKPKKNYDFT